LRTLDGEALSALVDLHRTIAAVTAFVQGAKDRD
jgi:hypothetical protein